MEVKKTEGGSLREVMVKIRLERIDTQEGIMVEVLLDSGATGLVMSSEFAKKTRVQIEEIKKADVCKECGWFAQQGGTNRTYSGSKYLLSVT